MFCGFGLKVECNVLSGLQRGALLGHLCGISDGVSGEGLAVSSLEPTVHDVEEESELHFCSRHH